MIGERRDPRLQHPLRHPVRHAPRGGGEAAGRADQGRPRHLRRSRPRGLRHERRAPPRSRSSSKVEFAGDTWLFFPTIVPQVAIIRATTADERGNLTYEHEGGYLGPLDQALAVRNNGGIVIAQVKRLAKSGTLKPQHVLRAGHSGRRHRRRARADADDADRLRPGDLRRGVPAAVESSRLAEFGVRQGDRAAASRRSCSDGDAVNIGFGISANVPRILIEEGRHGDVTWVIEQGAVGGVPLLDFQFGCAVECRGDRALALPVHLFPGRRLRRLAAFLPADRPGRLRQRLQARRAAARHGRRGRLRRHHGAGEEDRLLRLLQRRREPRRSRMGGSRSRARARS